MAVTFCSSCYLDTPQGQPHMKSTSLVQPRSDQDFLVLSDLWIGWRWTKVLLVTDNTCSSKRKARSWKTFKNWFNLTNETSNFVWIKLQLVFFTSTCFFTSSPSLLPEFLPEIKYTFDDTSRMGCCQHFQLYLLFVLVEFVSQLCFCYDIALSVCWEWKDGLKIPNPIQEKELLVTNGKKRSFSPCPPNA